MKRPRIAVLLAAYNGVHWLPEQVTSILEQEDVDVALFISVDSSDDGTEAWCEALQASNPAVTVLPLGLRFGGAGKNFFRLLHDVELASFDAISLADQDDIWYPDKLARAYQYIAQGNDAYSSNVLAFWPDGREMLVEKHQPRCNTISCSKRPGRVVPMCFLRCLQIGSKRFCWINGRKFRMSRCMIG